MEILIIILLFIILVCVCVICIYDYLNKDLRNDNKLLEEDVVYYKNLAATFEKGYDNLKNKH